MLRNKAAATVALLEFLVVMLAEFFLPEIGQIVIAYRSQAYLALGIEGFSGTGFVVRVPLFFDEFGPNDRALTCGTDKVMKVPFFF